MGETNAVYPVCELALSLESCTPLAGGHERKLAGDIIACRVPGSGIGTAEAHSYLWLRVEGLEENVCARLTDRVEEGGAAFDKRRYCIPLERLQAVVPTFDIARALDPLDLYQPFLVVDEDGPYTFLTMTPPLAAEGLIFDKVTGAYL